MSKLTEERIKQATKEAIKNINKEFVLRHKDALINMYLTDKNFKPLEGRK